MSGKKKTESLEILDEIIKQVHIHKKAYLKEPEIIIIHELDCNDIFEYCKGIINYVQGSLSPPFFIMGIKLFRTDDIEMGKIIVK